MTSQLGCVAGCRLSRWRSANAASALRHPPCRRTRPAASAQRNAKAFANTAHQIKNGPGGDGRTHRRDDCIPRALARRRRRRCGVGIRVRVEVEGPLRVSLLGGIDGVSRSGQPGKGIGKALYLALIDAAACAFVACGHRRHLATERRQHCAARAPRVRKSRAVQGGRIQAGALDRRGVLAVVA